MTHFHSPISYGDNLRMQPQLSKIVDRAVVKFVNQCNGEPNEMKGFDDPLFHLPKPEDSVSRVCAFRRWHGADWWMVLHEDDCTHATRGNVTRRVTILIDATEPDTLNFTPDLVVTRGGVRFILPQHESHFQEYQQQVSLFEVYGLLLLEATFNRLETMVNRPDVREQIEEIINSRLSRAWDFASEFNPDDATVSIP